MYITYRAREKLRAFTCTCGAREEQLAVRDVHLSLHACIDASTHARHTHTHVCMYTHVLECDCIKYIYVVERLQTGLKTAPKLPLAHMNTHTHIHTQ